MMACISFAGTPDFADHIAGWKLSETRVFDRDTLYDHIDGGAELFLTYDFRKMWSARYVREGQPDIQLDLSDMGQSSDAFGVFAHSLETPDSPDRQIGQGSQTGNGLVVCWQGNWFLSILASPPGDASARAIRELAEQVVAGLGAAGRLPAVLRYLPETDRIPGSERYFRHPLWLNSFVYLGEENPLNIDEQTHVAMARYRMDGESPAVLAAVCYPDETTAVAGEDRFRERMSGGISSGPFERAPGRFADVCRNGTVVRAVLDAPSEAACRKLMQRACGKMDHVEKEDDHER